jgi:hypothetical protein
MEDDRPMDYLSEVKRFTTYYSTCLYVIKKDEKLTKIAVKSDWRGLPGTKGPLQPDLS